MLRWRWASAVAFITGLAAVLWFFAGRSAPVIQKVSALSGIGSFLVGVAALMVAVLTLWLAQKQATVVNGERAQLEAAADLLAVKVRQQWTDEIGIRRLRHPRPLHLRWEPAASLAQTIVVGQGGLAGPDDTEQPARNLVDAFRRLPAQQLVILGAPGAGKHAGDVVHGGLGRQ